MSKETIEMVSLKEVLLTIVGLRDFPHPIPPEIIEITKKDPHLAFVAAEKAVKEDLVDKIKKLAVFRIKLKKSKNS